jgi:hypothetical protein
VPEKFAPLPNQTLNPSAIKKNKNEIVVAWSRHFEGRKDYLCKNNHSDRRT